MVKHWKYQELENLFSFVIGGDWGKDVGESDPDLVETYCIRGSELKDWRKHKGKTAALRKVSKSSLEKRKLQEGDILVEISGGGPDQPVGRTVVIDDDVLSFSPETPKVCTNFFRLVRLKDDVDKKFINYFLNYFYVSGQVVNYQGGSNNLRNLKFSEYSKINIPLPPLPEQKLIVAKLDTLFAHLDQLRSRLDKIPVLLKQFRQAVLTQAVTGKLTEEWRGSKALKTWKKVKLRDIIISIEAGKNFSCPEVPVQYGKVGLVKISAVTWDKFDATQTKTVGNLLQIKPQYFIKKGDFLISRANTIELVGSSVIVDEIEHDIMISDKVWRVTFVNDVTKTFVHWFLKSTIGRREIESRATGNQMSMRNLSQDNFSDIDILVPDATEQLQITNRIESVFMLADRLETRYESMKEVIERLPQRILTKAFRGELVNEKIERRMKAYSQTVKDFFMAAEPKDDY